MTHSEPAMTYLGRHIRFVESDVLGQERPMSHSTLLLWANVSPTPQGRLTIVQEILNSNPLAVLFGGIGSDILFGDLLHRLDIELKPRSMLTKFSTSDLSETVEEFFQATWPYESRIDDWNTYLLATDDENIPHMIQAVEAFLRCV